jgi:hypothetical protein
VTAAARRDKVISESDPEPVELGGRERSGGCKKKELTKFLSAFDYELWLWSVASSWLWTERNISQVHSARPWNPAFLPLDCILPSLMPAGLVECSLCLAHTNSCWGSHQYYVSRVMILKVWTIGAPPTIWSHVPQQILHQWNVMEEQVGGILFTFELLCRDEGGDSLLKHNSTRLRAPPPWRPPDLKTYVIILFYIFIL